LFTVALTAVLYGAAIEVIQPIVGRSGDLADFIADVLGIGLGAILGLMMNSVFRHQIKADPS